MDTTQPTAHGTPQPTPRVVVFVSINDAEHDCTECVGVLADLVDTPNPPLTVASFWASSPHDMSNGIAYIVTSVSAQVEDERKARAAQGATTPKPFTCAFDVRERPRATEGDPHVLTFADAPGFFILYEQPAEFNALMERLILFAAHLPARPLDDLMDNLMEEYAGEFTEFASPPETVKRQARGTAFEVILVRMDEAGSLLPPLPATSLN